MNTRSCFALLWSIGLVAPVTAQTLSGVTVAPSVIRPGDTVKITATFTDAESPNCNVRVHFGDGVTQNFKINQVKDVPLVTEHTYAKPGTYTVKVEPKTALPMLKCVGANQVATVTVNRPAKTVAPEATAPAAPVCPQGWTLNAKSVNKTTGTYTCTAKPGTALPVTKPTCPAPLGYFENQSKGQLGCRP